VFAVAAAAALSPSRFRSSRALINYRSRKKEILMSRRIAAPLALSIWMILFAALPAAADFVGSAGKIVGYLHNDNDSDDYGVYRGMVAVDEGGGMVQTYRWGGTLCAGRDLDIDQQSLLLQAIRSKMRILPYFKNGQAGIRCLVSFGMNMKPKYDASLAK